MKIIFDNPFYLVILLFFLVLIILIYFLSLKRAKRKALTFANFEAIEKIFDSEKISKNLTILYLQLIIISFIFLALANPSLLYTGLIADSDFVLAIDSSYSMMASDIFPNRLEAAKEAALIFVDNLEGQAKIGVVSFSGVSYVEQVLTEDRTKLKEAIKKIEKKEIGGTNVVSAIISSINLLRDSEKQKTIIVLTDGQINLGSIEDISDYSKEVVVHTIGIGTEEGGEMVSGAISKLDEQSLKQIANMTGGKYYRVTSKEELIKAYKEIANIKKGKKIINLKEILLIMAAIFSLVEWILINTKYRVFP